MLINNSVLEKAPFKISVLVVSLFLTVLFTVVEPATSQGMGFFARFIFWLLQIGVGLISIYAASLAIQKVSQQDFPVLVALGLAGIFGALIATPAFLFIELTFPGVNLEPDSWLDEFAQQGMAQALIAEFFEVLLPVTATWYVVNLPIIFETTVLKTSPPVDGGGDGGGASEIATEDPQEQRRNQVIEQFYQKLPSVIGRDIISISSDLHYLKVSTTQGNTLILGSISHIAKALDDEGFQVHRSYWVNKTHVSRVHVSGNNAVCIMSNGEHIPISRSKRKLVKAYFGNGVQLKLVSAQNHRKVGG